MFVNNKTPYAVALPRGEMLDGVFVAAIVATLHGRLVPGGIEWVSSAREPPPSTTPPLTGYALWQGASVTASGDVVGPGCAPHTAKVALRVGDTVRTLLVFGDRQWVKNAGKLTASAPAPWVTMPLSWQLAFGGAVAIAPGPFGPRQLPHPGGLLAHPLNPHGRGFCVDARRAEGALLPNIESPDEPMRTPTDQPRPVGFALCPDLPGLRLVPGEAPGDPEDLEGLLQTTLRATHPAPSELIFPSLSFGTEIEVSGLGPGRRFAIQAPPFHVVTRKGQSRTSIPGAVRHVHVDADEGSVSVTYGFPFAYEVAPSWVDVTCAARS